jgi:hypothetical protein
MRLVPPDAPSAPAPMTLPPPAARRPLHTRHIVCEGFQRDDGLFDIEARITDTKAFAYEEPFRGHREAGSHVHDMSVRLTVGADMVVHDIHVTMPSTPYERCQGAKPAYRALVGATIGGGWRRAVQEAVGSVRGCTHVRELLFPMATVAFQTIGGWRTQDGDGPRVQPMQRAGRPYFIDGCHGWAADGEVVAALHPEHAVPSRPTD